MDSLGGEQGHALTAVIVNHDQSIAVTTQFAGYKNQHPSLFKRIRWVVVSNGPTEPEPIDGVTLLRMANRGYGSAINHVALLYPDGPLLAMNADLSPEPGFLEGVLRAATAMTPESRRGIVGFRLKNPDGSPQGSVGRFPTLARFVRGLMIPRESRKYVRGLDEECRSVDWVTGACVLIDRGCFNDLRGFDDRFFLYYEDVDFCRRASQRGWRVEYDPSASCRHFFPYHRRRLTARMVAVARRALLLYFWKHRSRAEYHALAGIVRAELWGRGSRPPWPSVRDFVLEVLRNPATHEVDLARLPTE